MINDSNKRLHGMQEGLYEHKKADILIQMFNNYYSRAPQFIQKQTEGQRNCTPAECHFWQQPRSPRNHESFLRVKSQRVNKKADRDRDRQIQIQISTCQKCGTDQQVPRRRSFADKTKRKLQTN